MTRKTILFIALCLGLSQSILVQGVFAQPNKGDDSTDATILDRIRLESEETTGTIFREPDQVEVKTPLLKALIQTQVPLSPYQLDADSARSISLKDVCQAALDGNLSIKISNADREMGRWRFWTNMGQFLPEVVNGVSYQGIRGNYASPFGQIAPANSPYLVIPNSLNLYLFKGGTILFGALRASHDYKALNWSLKGTTNDVLFDASKLYYQLVLNNVLLQIRIKGVELGESLLARNNILFENGANTKLDVLQAKTQLSRDRQNLISQQIERRQSAINLATALNLDPSVDLLMKDQLVKKVRLVDSSLAINDLVAIAIKNRPELKKYEQLRLAARDHVRVVRGRLLPTVQGTATMAATGADAVNVQQAQSSSGSTSGMSAGSFSTSSMVPAGSGASSSPKFTTVEIYQIGINVQWALPGMGTVDAARVQEAKWEARRVQLEGVEQLNKVYKEVREAYLDGIKAESLINETTDYVNSSREQLSVATTRLAEGVDTDLAAVIAQRDYVNALADKANAIVSFNTAQVRLLRALGRITLDTLTSGVPIKD
ncbi:MAG: TolC family protein [Candidatus Obscuribacterales bacterium]|nr:TolC family protein [Candidatus Obscuribacterales bacterium]